MKNEEMKKGSGFTEFDELTGEQLEAVLGGDQIEKVLSQLLYMSGGEFSIENTGQNTMSYVMNGKTYGTVFSVEDQTIEKLFKKESLVTTTQKSDATKNIGKD